MIEELSNRDEEFNREQNIKKGWEISLKYSKLLEKKKSSSNIDNIILNMYELFKNDLRSLNLDISSKKKYNRCWITLINTCNNLKNNIDIIRNALCQFNYTIHINAI